MAVGDELVQKLMGEDVWKQKIIEEYASKFKKAVESKDAEKGIYSLYGLAIAENDNIKVDDLEKIIKNMESLKQNPIETNAYIMGIVEQVNFIDKTFGSKYSNGIEDKIKTYLIPKEQKGNQKEKELREVQYKFIENFFFNKKLEDKDKSKIKDYTIKGVEEYLQKKGRSKESIKYEIEALKKIWDDESMQRFAPLFLLDDTAYKSIMNGINDGLGEVKDYVKQMGVLNYLQAKSQGK